MDNLTQLQNEYVVFPDLLKTLERKKKKTPGNGFAKMKWLWLQNGDGGNLRLAATAISFSQMLILGLNILIFHWSLYGKRDLDQTHINISMVCVRMDLSLIHI